MFRKLPPLKSLLAFSAASRSQSYSSAAKELYITQSAVSHQIKNLEEFLGQKLFYREGKVLKLSPEGQIYAQKVNQSIEQLISATQELIGHHDNVLQFGVSSTFAIHRITPELNGLYQRHKELDIRLRMLSCSDVITALDLDVILYDHPIDHISYECVQLKNELHFPVANAELAKKLSKSPLEWHKETTLIDIETIDLWQHWFNEQGLKLVDSNIKYFLHSILILKAVIAGQGITFMGETLIRDELKSGALVKLSDTPIIFPDDGFYFAWHKRRKNDPNIRLLKNWLIGLL
jgi:DNA-binding transcriptional LysR family regulator